MPDDAGSACRGAINMRIARLNMDSQDKTRFEIHGKSSVKYHLKANHVVEAKRWFWTLNNAIQWAKDEAKEEERRRTKDAEALRQAKIDQIEGRAPESSLDSQSAPVPKFSNGKGLEPPLLNVPSNNGSGTKLSTYASRTTESAPGDEDDSFHGSFDQSVTLNEINKVASHVTTAPDTFGDDDDDDVYGEITSSRDIPSTDKDALNITAQSAKLQLDLLSNVAASLQAEKSKNPMVSISDPSVNQAVTAYEAAVSSLKELVQNLLKISRDRDAYWQYRLNREAYLRQMWEESMAKIAQEHEELQSKMGESEDKRRRTKKALKEALESASASTGPLAHTDSFAAHIAGDDGAGDVDDPGKPALETAQHKPPLDRRGTERTLGCRKSAISGVSTLYNTESDDDDEFFDAVDAGEIEAEDLTKSEAKEMGEAPKNESAELRAVKHSEVAPSFKGYEEPVRKRLKMDYDNRPKISLWVSNVVLSRLKLSKLMHHLGYFEIYDRKRHDKDDFASLFQ